MDRRELEAALRDSAEDNALSRGERGALKELLGQAAPSAHDLAYLRNACFKLAAEMQPTADPRVLSWLEDSIKLLLPRVVEPPEVEAHFSPGEACRRRIVAAFEAARQRADICVFTITDDHVSRAIADAQRRGVRVRLITDDDKSQDRGSDIERLSRAGVSVRTDRAEHHMHHKFALFDGRTVITGSYNWTRSAFAYNQENIVVIEDARVAARFAQEFERLWDRFA